MSPYERGFNDGRDLKPAPAFPRPDSPWSDRLYARGWSEGVDARRKADNENASNSQSANKRGK